MKYLIANWKAQMTFFQVQIWIQSFLHLVNNDELLQSKLSQDELTIIIAPASPFLMYVKEHVQYLPNIHVAAQDISIVEEGKFTGEITAKALQGIANFSIIGHSERRSHFHETEDDIQQKITQCKKYGIEPILCIRDEKDIIDEQIKIVAFEPVSAIGTGENMNLEEVMVMKSKLKLPINSFFLYGGSADEENCKDYITSGKINGFLVGTTSLNPQKFYEMAQAML